MRNSIKAKIIARTSIIVVIILVLSGVFYSRYFSNILREQAIKDDKIKLSQTARQIEYITDDIRKFAYGIIIDTQLQEFYKLDDEDAVTEYFNTFNAMKRLTDLALLREYIHSAVCVKNNGESVYNLYPNYGYFKEKLEENWYLAFLESDARTYFSTVHNIDDRRENVDVISYIVDFRDAHAPEQSLGHLILNIKHAYFVRYMELEDDGFLWCNQDGDVLYSMGERLDQSYLALLNDGQNRADTSMIEQQDGYIVEDRSMNNGWVLYAFTSNQTLYAKTNFVYYIFGFFMLGSLLLVVVMIRPIALGITKPITQLSNAMTQFVDHEMKTDAIDINIDSGDEVEMLGHCFNQMTADLQKYVRESIENEKIKKDMAFNLLISQINPHFIYNTLNTIIYMAKKQDNQDIMEITDAFISILQDAVRIGEDGTTATIRQEIDVVNHYAVIQGYRYPRRFDLQWDVDDMLLDCEVPKTIIQPLVENALLHGIFPHEHDGHRGVIKIMIKRIDDDIRIAVEDNGVGMDGDQLRSILETDGAHKSDKIRHIGIAMIRGRIKYLFGSHYDLDIKSSPSHGTRVIVTLPIQSSY